MKITLKSDTDSESSGDFERTEITSQSVFEAKILSVENRETKWWATYKDGEQKLDDDGQPYKNREFNFRFEIQDEGGHKGRWVWGSTSTWFSMKPTCKLANWIKQILDEPVLPEGFSIDIDGDPNDDEVNGDLVGLHCRVVVEAKKREDGKWSNWVSDVHPTKAGETTQDRMRAHLAGNSDGPSDAPVEKAYDPQDEPF